MDIFMENEAGYDISAPELLPMGGTGNRITDVAHRTENDQAAFLGMVRKNVGSALKRLKEIKNERM